MLRFSIEFYHSKRRQDAEPRAVQKSGWLPSNPHMTLQLQFEKSHSHIASAQLPLSIMSKTDLHAEFVNSSLHKVSFVDELLPGQQHEASALMLKLIDVLKALELQHDSLYTYAAKLEEGIGDFPGRDEKAEHVMCCILERLCEQGIHKRMLHPLLYNILRRKDQAEQLLKYEKMINVLYVVIIAGLDAEPFLKKQRV